MRRIKLIVTGDMEKLALHKSLQRFFPNERDGQKVIWDQPRKIQCATSYPLSPLQTDNSNLSTAIKQLAQAMLDEALVGKKGKPADLVVVIDDVELGNLGQENVIAEYFRAAVEKVLEAKKYSRHTEDCHRKRLREKCSFHLLKPMVESYLFGDANALRLAGVPVGESPKLVHLTDVEQFETNDPLWLPTCLRENEKRRHSKSWWHHERHPKHYLEHLTERGQVFYDETTNGKKALEWIAWRKVPKYADDTPFIRSLFEDIADWFGIPNPLGKGETNPNFYPPKSVNRANLLLRNM
ncbi:MAG TPA: hypothetical protein EYP59_06975 [Thiotrichaceae bacterium]|nr:hypothetical protein [Thiotrichaceae bacterium]